ncbi:hypothetical protein Tco_0762851, partial [Tanacetum coccineum]
TKKTGKRRKQIARKGLHSDKTDKDEYEASKDDDPISDVYMLIERKYPLPAEVCKAMLDKKLQGGKPDDDFQPVLLTHDMNYDGEEEEFEDTNGDIDLDSSNHSSDDDA